MSQTREGRRGYHVRPAETIVAMGIFAREGKELDC